MAERATGPGHLLDRRAAVGPVRVRVQVALERSAQRGGPLADRGVAERLDPAQVDRLLAGQRLGDHRRGDLADAGQLGQRARPDPVGQLGRAGGGDRAGRRAEGPNPVGGLQGALEAEGDAAQVLDRVARARHAGPVPRGPLRPPGAAR